MNLGLKPRAKRSVYNPLNFILVIDILYIYVVLYNYIKKNRVFLYVGLSLARNRTIALYCLMPIGLYPYTVRLHQAYAICTNLHMSMEKDGQNRCCKY